MTYMMVYKDIVKDIIKATDFLFKAIEEVGLQFVHHFISLLIIYSIM